jgi:hypothetical protein
LFRFIENLENKKEQKIVDREWNETGRRHSWMISIYIHQHVGLRCCSLVLMIDQKLIIPVGTN